jgi:hypothetical protein
MYEEALRSGVTESIGTFALGVLEPRAGEPG